MNDPHAGAQTGALPDRLGEPMLFVPAPCLLCGTAPASTTYCLCFACCTIGSNWQGRLMCVESRSRLNALTTPRRRRRGKGGKVAKKKPGAATTVPDENVGTVLMDLAARLSAKNVELREENAFLLRENDRLTARCHNLVNENQQLHDRLNEEE